MKSTILSLFTAIIILALATCSTKNKPNTEIQEGISTSNQSTKDMKSYISIFEIPATDISRAIEFYQGILGISIEKMEMAGLKIGLLPFEGQMVTGVIMEGEGNQPSADGITIYLNGGDNLQAILDKVEENGGKILVPKTPHADESGFFALFLDTEGNKMGLHSPN